MSPTRYELVCKFLVEEVGGTNTSSLTPADVKITLKSVLRNPIKMEGQASASPPTLGKIIYRVVIDQINFDLFEIFHSYFISGFDLI